MRRVFVILSISLLSYTGYSQTVFDKYENSENVASLSINKGLLELVANMSSDDQDAETKEFLEMVKHIDGIKVFISENGNASADMALTMKKYVRQKNLEELMRVRDGETNVRFYVKTGRNANRVKELLMFVTGIDKKDNDGNDSSIETVLLTMTGNIELDKVGSLVNKMNLPKELNQIEKGK
ncbi:Hypothetical protein I595_652 [Croceitalea dokdonensis DOKDO 023]|uniref:DUF4252 domain-containing protein n=1 Tax=Croceitalea dokdonensis DOKDO 023 TaxID=1300341 RepID=A0A0P7AA33_9FLAO|nr:DUF4252 domain-containing protein [Croceitalea dokdonensis]KPM33746.1 Hypothetical protein I595_652 [Croceitalea dokdonensis DOKDO 023]